MTLALRVANGTRRQSRRKSGVRAKEAASREAKTMTLSVRTYDLSAASGKRNARAEQTQVRCPSEGSGEPKGEDDDAQRPDL